MSVLARSGAVVVWVVWHHGKRKPIGDLSSGCSCWGADHSSLDHGGSGDKSIGDGGYCCLFGLVVGVFVSFDLDR